MKSRKSGSMVTRSWFRIALSLSFLLSYVAWIPVQSGKASTVITVNSTIDSLSNDGLCTLREAVIAANKDSASGRNSRECAAGAGADTIKIPPGEYVLTRIDNGKEDSSSTGDLDILADVTIEASGPGVVIRGGSGFADHIFQILSGKAVLRGLTLQEGAVKGDGGSIFNSGTLLIENVTITGNRASGRGGGIYNHLSGNLTMVNSTISGNASQGDGGGLFSTGTADLNNVTITANTADADKNNLGDGGGYAGQGVAPVIRNTIIAGNIDASPGPQSPDYSGPLNSGGYNLIGVNPGLQDLGQNGGYTATHALLAGSPAIDAGNPSVPGSGGEACAATDQRGAHRPRGEACDIGAFEAGKPNSSIVIRAFSVTGGTTTTVVGRLSSAADLTFYVQFFASATCDPAGTGSAVGSPVPITTDSKGNVIFTATVGTSIPQGRYLWAVTQDPEGNLSEPSACVRVGAGNDSWPSALQVYPENSPTFTAQANEYIDLPGQSRWYKFAVQPNSKVVVTLTGLPANYDLTIYKDISQAFKMVDSTSDLLRLGAEFAPEAFTPDEFSPEAFTPEAFTPEAFTPEAFTPEAFTPEAFTPEAFTPEAFTPEAFTPEAFTPDAYSPEAFTPEAFTPEAFTPEAFTPEAFTPEAFTSAQTRSLIGISAYNGLVGEGLRVNTWDNNGFYYVRVRGRNGAFNPDASYHLEVRATPGACSGILADFRPSTTQVTAGDYRTLILTNLSRLEGSDQEKSGLMDKLLALAARGEDPDRGEVAGRVKIIDLSQDDRIIDANAQADQYPACPYAKNLVASSIKEIIDAYWAENPNLQYLVLVGSDDVIPFYRHPDHAMLGNEKSYVPPVKDATASQASLKLGYVYSQDDYGARQNISLKDDTFPVPELAVGRLVETAAEASAMLDAYLETYNGVVNTPTSALVTGYDFLEDVSNEVSTQLSSGLNAPVDSLITPADVSPNGSPSGETPWTADQLRAALIGERHDLVFLAGHFSATGALAADFRTRLLSSELASSNADLKNAIIYSAGCHSGYNIVNGHGISGVTREPDWAQAFARRQATLIAGTGYQYGDTDFIRYSEKIYLEFTRELRAGEGPVSVGQALVKAKHAYLASTPYLRGIDEKAVLEATLFGLPMLSVNMPGTRLSQTGLPPAVGGTEGYATNPGKDLGLRYFDLQVTPQLVQHTVEMQNLQGAASTTQAIYFSGPQGVVANPNEPILPHAQVNVSAPASTPDIVLRGVGFRAGMYEDLGREDLDGDGIPDGILPFTGATATEIRGVHTPFLSNVFFPAQTWRVNYFEALTNGATLLSVFPVQYQSSSPASITGTLRKFNSMGLRLFYNGHITSYDTGTPNESTPALSAPPSIVKISSRIENGAVHFQAHVVGNPAAGIQEVWVTYTGINGPMYGAWASKDLAQNLQDSTLWEATLPLNGVAPGDVRFIVQAVNGVGLVSMDTNQGAYYIPGIDQGAGQTSHLEFIPSPGSSAIPDQGRYSEQVSLSAHLTSNGENLAGKVVVFTLGPQSRVAITDDNGQATVALSIFGLPDPEPTQISVSFAGDSEYQASFDDLPFTIYRQFTKIELEIPSEGGFPEADALIVATLTDDDGDPQTPGRRLSEETLFFVIHGNGLTYVEAVITDYAGRAPLGHVPLPAGDYTVDVYFSGQIPLAEPVTITDDRYEPTFTSGSLTLLNHPPIAVDDLDLYQVDEDQMLSVSAPGVLTNDSDLEGAQLQAILVSGPANGLLSLNADGSFIYDSNQDFYGTDSFTYKASDGTAESNIAEVTITVNPVNDTPVAVADTYTTDEDTLLSVSFPGVLFNDADVESALTAILVSQPVHGTLTLNPDGSFTYLPGLDFNGGDSFTYQASDGSLSSAPALVSLTVNAINDAPICSQVVPSSDKIWSPNSSFVTVTIQNVTDPDGDAITINITGVFQDEPVGKVADARNIVGNSVDLRGERDGNGDGRFYHVFFTATDGQGGSCSGQVVVSVVAHDQSGGTSVDGGPLYDSTVPQ